MDVAKHRLKFSKGVVALIASMIAIVAIGNAESMASESDLKLRLDFMTEPEAKEKVISEIVAKYQYEAKRQYETEVNAEISSIHQQEMKTKAEAIAKAEVETNNVAGTEEQWLEEENNQYQAQENSERDSYIYEDYEIGWIVQIVQHEVGNEPEVYPDYDFDIIQQYMTRVVVNRIGIEGWNSVEEVLFAPGQFCPLEELNIYEYDDDGNPVRKKYDPNDELTLKNVFTVLNGEDGISEDVLYEMSWDIDTDVDDAIASMERQVGTIYDTYVVYANCPGYKELLIFGYQEKGE